MFRKILIFAALASLSTLPSAAATIFERDLPNASNGGTTYVNNAAGANRANFDWASPDPANFAIGDNFTSTITGTVNSITVYEISNAQSGGNTAPGSEFNNITLLYGPEDTLTQSQATYTAAKVTYQPGSVNFEGAAAGNLYDVYALTFSNLGLSVAAGSTYGFALKDTPAAAGNTLALAASNGALTLASGAAFDTASTGNDAFTYYNPSTGAAISYCGSAGGCEGTHPSDINVIVNGTAGGAVPEPSSLGLIGLGAACIAAWRVRKQA